MTQTYPMSRTRVWKDELDPLDPKVYLAGVLSCYLTGENPYLEEAIQIAEMEEEDFEPLYDLMVELQHHDGCVSNDDAARLALYLYQNGVRKTKPEQEDE